MFRRQCNGRLRSVYQFISTLTSKHTKRLTVGIVQLSLVFKALPVQQYVQATCTEPASTVKPSVRAHFIEGGTAKRCKTITIVRAKVVPLRCCLNTTVWKIVLMHIISVYLLQVPPEEIEQPLRTELLTSTTEHSTRKEGMLYKKGRIVKNWKFRYFVLNEEKSEVLVQDV